MDSILYLGSTDEQLHKLLKKLGYEILVQDTSASLPDFIAQTNLDLILIDGRVPDQILEMCSFLRTQDNSKKLPIVVIGPENNSEVQKLEEELKKDTEVEFVPAPLSVGRLAGKIATRLRLRKFAGKDELKSTLSEMNASLRDFNDRIKKELEEARAIQQSLLPEELPSHPGVQIAASYQPLEEVGGDWYFAKKYGNNKIALQIADVTGHGLSAAFIGSMAKLAMSAADKERPDELLCAMNRLMAPQIPSGRFMTMASCLYDPATGVLQFARAGHPPALLFRKATGEVAQLHGDGFALGFFEDAEYALVEDQLQPGDLFLLYTDGISEAQNRSLEVYGHERLAAALSTAAAAPSAAEVLERILDQFDQFREERILKDDVTLAVLKRVV